MGQVSAKMRRTTTGFAWWCPACAEMHPLPDGWTFDGNVNSPTFSPSFRHGPSIMAVTNDKGEWNGRWWALDKSGQKVERTCLEDDDKPVMWCCHYIVTAGQVAYCGDCTHAMANQTIAMPDLPEHMRDDRAPAT